MALDPILDELKELKKNRKKVRISKRILFKKISVMHEKGEFLKLREAFTTFP